MPSNKESNTEKAEEKPYPKSIFFIIGNEFCERFTFYGLRTVLTIYLKHRLFYSDNTATIVYHLFSMLAYFTPVFGAMLADSLLGKFKTILYLSILYCIGSIVLSIGAFPNALGTMEIISLVGLLLIAVGTGGIKPCVSAFGGDQFRTGQEKQLQQFFSVFYISINLGSLISTFLTPILREDVHCLGDKSCFPLAFGVPSILMIVAVLLFVGGKPFYIIRPPEGNIVLKVSKCVCYALGKKIKSSEKKKAHWLDYAEDKFDKKLIEDIKILFHVLVLYIPLPIFWALFDQLGSRWTLQATRMDGSVGGYHIKADQMQVINPFMIITFIPLFTYVIYPFLDKCGILTKPLQRITAGGVLAGISFVMSGLIELNLETALPVMPESGFSEMTIINNSPCPVKIEGINLPGILPFETEKFEMTLGQQSTWNFIAENCSDSAQPFTLTFNSTSVIESMMVTIQEGKLTAMKNKDSKEKTEDGEPQVKLFYNVDKIKDGNITFLIHDKEKGHKYFFNTESAETVGMTEYYKIPPGKYLIYAPYNSTQFLEIPVAQGDFKTGGLYIVKIYNKAEENRKISSVYEMVKGNFFNILYQIPQYMVITAGEIMFSITGLEFSYSQAPLSMKSVLQAAWLLSVAVGNLIVLVIAKLHLFEKMSNEMFLFAVLMGLDMIAFGILAYFYKYVTIKSGDEVEVSSPKGRNNDGYVDETDFNK